MIGEETETDDSETRRRKIWKSEMSRGRRRSGECGAGGSGGDGTLISSTNVRTIRV